MSLVAEVKGFVFKDLIGGTRDALKHHFLATALFAVGVAAFLALAVYRMYWGLGITNVNDMTAWGLWTAFKLTCVVVSGCAFVITGMVYVLGLEKFRPLVKSAALIGLLGYSTFALTLVLELGFPYRIVHPIWMWQHHSILFEVAACVMLYLTVLSLEFTPNVFERFKMPGLLALVKKFTVALVIAGVVLSVLHQSSLGSLFIMCKHKMNHLWFSPWVGPFFIISAMYAGLALVILVELLMSRFDKRKARMDLLGPLAMISVAVLALYFGFKVMDVLARPLAREAFFAFNVYSLLFILEIGVGILLPIFLFASRKVRESKSGIGFTAALVVLFGGALNRLNVSVIALDHSPLGYMPNWIEYTMVAATLISVIGVFVIITRLFPIYGPREKAE
jgi:Ni/Fe-hydrogenase subunit HybB-like protein